MLHNIHIYYIDTDEILGFFPFTKLWLLSLGQRVLDTCSRAGIYFKHDVVLQNSNSGFTLGGDHQTE